MVILLSPFEKLFIGCSDRLARYGNFGRSFCSERCGHSDCSFDCCSDFCFDCSSLCSPPQLVTRIVSLFHEILCLVIISFVLRR